MHILGSYRPIHVYLLTIDYALQSIVLVNLVDCESLVAYLDVRLGFHFHYLTELFFKFFTPVRLAEVVTDEVGFHPAVLCYPICR